MCDCYWHKCECCKDGIPMHIADYRYPQSDFKVWCPRHVAKAPAGAVLFELTEEDDEYPKGWTCAIFGPDIGLMGGNYPNVEADWKETRLGEIEDS